MSTELEGPKAGFNSYYEEHAATQAVPAPAPPAVPNPAKTVPVKPPQDNQASNGGAHSVDEVKLRVHTKVVEALQNHEIDRLGLDERVRVVRRSIEYFLPTGATVLNQAEREHIIADLLDDILGLGPLEKLLRDQTVSDILVNGTDQIYVERRGVLEESPVRFRNYKHLMQVIDRIVSSAGRHIDETSPMVDCRLSDGSRVNAIIPPLALRGPSLSIRRFGYKPLGLDDLISLKMFPRELLPFLDGLVKARVNILITGGTGSGKTTFLNSLSRFIPHDERIVTIEDAAELQLQQRHVVQLQSRPKNIQRSGEVTIHDLVRNSLRMRPNRIIVGECRGKEVLDMLQAMNTGHDGSLTTLHANSPRDAMRRLEMMIMLSGVELPVKAMRQQISSAINIIIHTARLLGGPRRLMSITEITGMEGDIITMQDLFTFEEGGVGPDGKAIGQFEASGNRPGDLLRRMQAHGIDLPGDLFRARVLMNA